MNYTLRGNTYYGEKAGRGGFNRWSKWAYLHPQWCPTLCEPLEQVAIASSRDLPHPGIELFCPLHLLHWHVDS